MADLEMFWGGAPQPLNQDRINPNEFQLERNEDDGYETEVEYHNRQTGERGVAGPRQEPEEKKSLRAPGGIAAISKKITADYDSDDARIIELKQQGYADELVADRLKKEGRIRYVGKTVGSRWLRLRKVLEDREDERLDDELSDWHVGEDAIMANIKDEVDKKYELQFQRLREKMWKEVSIYLADKIGKRKYTAKACYERFEAIKDGTALIPIELDDDQAGRRRLREARVTKAKADRAADEKARQDAEDAKKARAEARKKAREDATIKKQTETARKIKERKERDRIKKEREVLRQRMKVAREIRLAEIRAQRDWQMEKWRGEKKLYSMLTGKNMPGTGADGQRKKKTKDGYETDGEDEDDLDGLGLTDESEAEMSDVENNGEDDEGDDAGVPLPVRDSVLPSSSKKRTTARRRTNPVRKTRGRVKAQASSPTGPALPLPAEVEDTFNKATVTKETLLNPRSIMSMDELDQILAQRELVRRHPTESHAEVVARLAHADGELTVLELNELLKAASKPVSGKKDVKIQRLQAYDAAQSERGSAAWHSSGIDFMRSYDGYQGEFAYLLDEAEEALDAMDVVRD